MTEYANELVGRKIQIKDMNTGKAHCQYKDYSIRFCKKDRVKISASGLSSPGCREVSVLIFGAHRLLEYYGNMNKPVIANELEIESSQRAGQRGQKEVAGMTSRHPEK